jgi:hypothetical protein
MASTYLTRTFGSAGNRQSWTWSGWIKKSKIYNSTSSGDREVWFGGYSASSESGWLEFGTQGDIFYYTTPATTSSGNRLMRDPNGWFHAVVTYDGSNIKFYYNNELDFNNTQLSGDRGINVAGVHTIGALASNQSSRRFNGVMSHVHFIDGAVLAPTVFGETDSVTGEWKIIVEPTVSSYGTNGFFILKDGNSVTDQSPNTNNFTVAGGTLTKTEDNPSNVFATFNPLMHFRQPTPLLYGNTGIENGDTQWENGYGTIATPTTGKFYAEFKYPAFGGTSYGHAGIIAVDDIATQASGYLNFGDAANSWSISVTDGSVYNNGSSIATYSSISANGIIGLAIDCTNSKLYISVNGTWQNSADPSSGTGGISITSNKEYFVGGKVYNAYINANFGNGYFGTTAVSSAGTNASGNGIFEYDVPTGYTALSTKGLNT